MKYGVLLLAFLTLFLSVKSGVAPILQTEVEIDACCKNKKEQADKPIDKNGSCDDNCSPFQSCCPYITLSSIKYSLSSLKIFRIDKKGLPLYHIPLFSSYSPDFWQPPKIV